MILRASDLDEPRFPAAQLKALFDAILINDEVDACTPLPDTITLDFDQRQLLDCFRLSRQLWQVSGHRKELRDLLRKIARDGDLDASDRLRFKHVRAKFKHLRFAHALYGTHHRYPTLLNWKTTAMGRLQDAVKSGDTTALRREIRILRVFLSWGPQKLMAHETDRLSLTSSAGFRAYVTAQIASLRQMVDKDAVTGAEFHAMRKIISRQVSFYDDLRTITPSTEAFRMARALAAINGLMGRLHDDLVVEKIAGTRDYDLEKFSLPDAIGTRLRDLADRYPS